MKLTTAMLLTAAAVMAQSDAPAKSSAKPNHVLLTPDAMQWMPAPAATGMPSAVGVSLLSGDPFKTGPFVIRLKIPADGKIAAHWHPTDENITVIEGTFAAGMGDKFSEAELHDFPVGSYVVMPKTMHHFAMAKGAEVIVQIHGLGPFVLNYVDPADDPRKK
ncbi:MAG: cupin domain-containing protein [Bryobacteraceae bacterium]